VDIVFGNVRDASWLTEDHFRARPGSWRFVIDHPFDDPGHSTAEDLSRLDQLRAGGLESPTIVWLPRFLSEERMREVRRLVILDWLLGGSGERWTTHADHLSEVDRVQARAILESQRSALREGLRRSVQEAYGAAAPSVGTLAEDAAHDRVLVSLDSRLDPARPVGADLAAAFGHLVDQAFTATYPGHPVFEPGDVEVAVRELSTVYGYVERAATDREGRVPTDPHDRPTLRRVANALHVGSAGETHFLFGDDRFAFWGAEFARAAGRDGIGAHEPVDVRRLRGWVRGIRPALGLRDEVADLVLLAWAALRQRAWYQNGAPIPVPKPGALRESMELRPQPMPAPADWEAAVTRTQSLFGLGLNRYLTAPAVADLTEQVRRCAELLAGPAEALADQLRTAYALLGIDPAAGTGRLATARAAAELVTRLQRAPDRVQLIETLARFALPATEPGVAKSLSSAAEAADALKAFRWARLRPLAEAESRGDERGRAAAATMAALRRDVQADELVTSLRRALAKADDAVFDWLAGQPIEEPRRKEPEKKPDDVPLDLPPGATDGHARRDPGGAAEPVIGALRAFLDAHPDDQVVVEWRIEP
jgi:hypothetical protein